MLVLRAMNKIKHLPKDREKLLIGRGASAADMMHGAATFDVLESLTKYETEIPGMHSKIVSVRKQLAALTSIVENPIRARYTACFNSFPSDLLAKHLAIHVFDLAFKAWQSKHRPGRVQPLWHRAYGGLSDGLRDRKSDEMPSLLVISNVNDTSSNYKLEKVRDLLEMFADIPRIVVTSSRDPVTFFSTKLRFPVNYGIHLGPANRIKEL